MRCGGNGGTQTFEAFKLAAEAATPVLNDEFKDEIVNRHIGALHGTN
jgi:hypothetical protein